MRITELERTCGAHPSQWEGVLDDGQHIYIRYRGGVFAVGVGATADSAVDATIDGNELLRLNRPDGGGYMTNRVMRELLAAHASVYIADDVMPADNGRDG